MHSVGVQWSRGNSVNVDFSVHKCITLHFYLVYSHWSMTAELAAAQEKQMEVCPVCGAFLIVGDAQQRIDDHLSGKQHVGYDI